MDRQILENIQSLSAQIGLFLTAPALWFIYLIIAHDKVSPFLLKYMPYVCGVWLICLVAAYLFEKQIKQLKTEEAIVHQKIATMKAQEEVKEAKERAEKQAAQKARDDMITKQRAEKQAAQKAREDIITKQRARNEELRKQKEEKIKEEKRREFLDMFRDRDVD